MITGLQRSTLNVILCKNMGHVKVPYFILNHGLPELLNAPVTEELPKKALLHNMLDEGMHWHASLLQSLLEHETDPNIEQARRLSALDEHIWQQKRQDAKAEAKDLLHQGKALAQKRDTGKRKYEDMSAAEQQILEDYDTQKLRKQHDEASGSSMPSLRGRLL